MDERRLLQVVIDNKLGKELAQLLYDTKKELFEKVEKILVSLAYQKVNGKLIRVNINHLDVIKRLEKQLIEV